MRMDGHMALANSAALQLAGIGPDTPSPEAGQIDKDGEGRPTGILRCAAARSISRPGRRPWRPRRCLLLAGLRRFAAACR
jgi:hypothetical protein